MNKYRATLIGLACLTLTSCQTLRQATTIGFHGGLVPSIQISGAAIYRVFAFKRDLMRNLSTPPYSDMSGMSTDDRKNFVNCVVNLAMSETESNCNEVRRSLDALCLDKKHYGDCFLYVNLLRTLSTGLSKSAQISSLLESIQHRDPCGYDEAYNAYRSIDGINSFRDQQTFIPYKLDTFALDREAFAAVVDVLMSRSDVKTDKRFKIKDTYSPEDMWISLGIPIGTDTREQKSMGYIEDGFQYFTGTIAGMYFQATYSLLPVSFKEILLAQWQLSDAKCFDSKSIEIVKSLMKSENKGSFLTINTSVYVNNTGKPKRYEWRFQLKMTQ